MNLVFEPAARAEFLRATQRYAREAGTVIASDFNTEVKNTLAMLADNPLLGFAVSPNIRRFPLRRFPFTLFYRDEADNLRIIAVAHQSRMPEYWRQRS